MRKRLAYNMFQHTQVLIYPKTPPFTQNPFQRRKKYRAFPKANYSSCDAQDSPLSTISNKKMKNKNK